MTVQRLLRTIQRDSLRSAPLLAQGVVLHKDAGSRRVTAALRLAEGEAELVLIDHGAVLELILQAEDASVQKQLRNSMLGASQLRSLPEEHHLLEAFTPEVSAAEVLGRIAAWVQEITRRVEEDCAVASGGSVPGHLLLGYWWDSKANFGDAAGPWLLQAMTGRRVVNARHTKNRERALGSVGSLFQMLNRGRLDMWGSGILYPPEGSTLKRLKKLRGVTVHAVRGPKTKQALEETLGWEVPEVYGDPALLFPRYFTPERAKDPRRIAFVPHLSHMRRLPADLPPEVELCRVTDDVETVVESIASAGVCIATSLHGIIFAQAYGVPWVWLNVEDRALKGGEFKFEDFFATLDAGQVARAEVRISELADLDFAELAGSASLPGLTIDLDALEEAFPLPRAPRPTGQGTPQFDWRMVPGEERAAAYTRVLCRRFGSLRTRIGRKLAAVPQRSVPQKGGTS